MSRISEYLRTVEGKIVCDKCGYVFGSNTEEVRKAAKSKLAPLTKAGPLCNPWTENRVALREFYCPGCATMFLVEVAMRE